MRNRRVLKDFEDSDALWADGQSGTLPRSTLTGKTVLREVRHGHTVQIDFDSGDHDATKAYITAMAREYSLLLDDKDSNVWYIGPAPDVCVSAV